MDRAVRSALALLDRSTVFYSIIVQYIGCGPDARIGRRQMEHSCAVVLISWHRPVADEGSSIPVRNNEEPSRRAVVIRCSRGCSDFRIDGAMANETDGGSSINGRVVGGEG